MCSFLVMYDIDRDVTNLVCKIIMMLFVGIFSFVTFTIGASLSLCILSWTWPCGTLWLLGTIRFPNKKSSIEFYFSMLKWIQSAEKHQVHGQVAYTKQHDKMMRLCSLNSILQAKLPDSSL